MIALLKVFDLVPGWLWAILLVGAIGAGCAEKNLHLHTKMQAAEFKQQAAEKESQRNIVARQAETLRADLNALRGRHAQEIQDALREDRRMARAAVAADMPRRDELRNATAVAASPRADQGGGDPAALARATGTATALGSLLERCDAVAERLGGHVEKLAGQVRSLIAQYDSLSLRPAASTFDPRPDSGQVDPSTRLRWDHVVDTTEPHLALKPGLNLGLSFLRVDPLVLGQWNPAAHHALSDPR